jgi:hypothetical protein
MIQRAIAAALLVGLVSPAFAQKMGPAYDQAAGLAAGKSPDAAYDGSAARTAVQVPPPGAAASAAAAVETTPAATAIHPNLEASKVPEPDAAKGKFFTKAGLKFGAVGALTGGAAGWILGGPIGAAIGIVAGFAIGFLLSKVLRKR